MHPLWLLLCHQDYKAFPQLQETGHGILCVNNLPTNRIKEIAFYYNPFQYLHTLFQFSLTIAPTQNAGLISDKK